MTVGNLIKNKRILSKIVENLSKINNITVSGFTFQNSDTASAYSLARKAAVSDSRAKVNQYASLTGKAVRGVRKVVDQNQDRYIPFSMNANYYALRAQTLEVPFGKVSVSARVQIQWNV